MKGKNLLTVPPPSWIFTKKKICVAGIFGLQKRLITGISYGTRKQLIMGKCSVEHSWLSIIFEKKKKKPLYHIIYSRKETAIGYRSSEVNDTKSKFQKKKFKQDQYLSLIFPSMNDSLTRVDLFHKCRTTKFWVLTSLVIKIT